MPIVDGLAATVARNRADCSQNLADTLVEISDSLGLPRPTSAEEPANYFGTWFTDCLSTAGVEPRYVRRLVDAAMPIALSSAALTAIARTAWIESEDHVNGMDAFLTGSVARSEACPVSDFDFDFLAKDDRELKANGLAEAARVTTQVENGRTRVMGQSDWYNRFRESAGALGFEMNERHLAYVLTVDELDTTRLAMTLGFERYATNYLSATKALGQSERWASAEPLLIAGLTLQRALDQKADLVRRYLGQLRVGPRPHTAHGVLSQTWQAILYIARGVASARIPYWAIPLVVPLDRRAQRQWTVAFTALGHYRMGEDGTIALYSVTRALLEVIRCCRVIVPDPASLAELDAMFTLDLT